jgi:hypothetical protein
MVQASMITSRDLLRKLEIDRNVCLITFMGSVDDIAG